MLKIIYSIKRLTDLKGPETFSLVVLETKVKNEKNVFYNYATTIIIIIIRPTIRSIFY